MWRNNGNGTFTDVTSTVGLFGNALSVAAVGTDYNNDRAVDLIVSGGAKGATLFENPREGMFTTRDWWVEPMRRAASGGPRLDFPHDGLVDPSVSYSPPPPPPLPPPNPHQ